MADAVVNEKWLEAWESGNFGWHKKAVNKNLMDHADLLFGGRSNLRVFVPMCGKSIDMKWLAELGHSVVGVELADAAVKAFFQEQNLTYSVKPIEQVPGNVYQAKDANILIYCCDLFLVNKELLGSFDAIWDRGSLGAIQPDSRTRYRALMMSLMTPKSRYLLSVMEFQSEYKGPPYNMPTSDLRELYGDCCNVELLKRAASDCGGLPPQIKKADFAVYFITLK